MKGTGPSKKRRPTAADAAPSLCSARFDSVSKEAIFKEETLMKGTGPYQWQRPSAADAAPSLCTARFDSACRKTHIRKQSVHLIAYRSHERIIRAPKIFKTSKCTQSKDIRDCMTMLHLSLLNSRPSAAVSTRR